MSATTVQRPPRNGVDVPTLFATLDAVKASPRSPSSSSGRRNEWVSGTHNRTTIQGFYGAGQEDTSRTGAVHATTPTTRPCWSDRTTARLRWSSCCTRSPPASPSGIANIAAARGVTLRRVTSTVEGDIDLLGILGLSDESATATGRSGCTSTSRATRRREELVALVERSRRRSAVYDVLANGTDVQIDVSTPLTSRPPPPPAEADTGWDAIVVGARVAGASTALLLARAGLRVLVVDRARRGSDTLSTHALMRGGVLQLQRWGLLDRVARPARRRCAG